MSSLAELSEETKMSVSEVSDSIETSGSYQEKLYEDHAQSQKAVSTSMQVTMTSIKNRIQAAEELEK